MDVEKVEKVITGIDICFNNKKCDKCGYEYENGLCLKALMNDALSVIRELKAENERLRQEKADAVKRITEERERVCECYRLENTNTAHWVEAVDDREAFEYFNGLGKALEIITGKTSI